MRLSILRVLLTLVLVGLFFMAPNLVAIMLIGGLFYLLADAIVRELFE